MDYINMKVGGPEESSGWALKAGRPGGRGWRVCSGSSIQCPEARISCALWKHELLPFILSCSDPCPVSPAGDCGGLVAAGGGHLGGGRGPNGPGGCVRTRNSNGAPGFLHRHPALWLRPQEGRIEAETITVTPLKT